MQRDDPVDTLVTPLYFTPVDSPTAFIVAFDTTLALPSGGPAEDSAVVLPAGAGTAGVVVRISGNVSLGGLPVPIGEVVEDGGILSYTETALTAPRARGSAPARDIGSVVIVSYQPLRLRFVATTPDSDIEVPPAVNVDPELGVVYLRLNHLGALPLRLAWSLVPDAGLSLGLVSSFTGAGCVPVYDGRCVPLPPDSRVSNDAGAQGRLRVQLLTLPTGRLALSLTRQEVRPVWAHQFNAVSQYTFDPDPRERTRRDTVRVLLRGGAARSSVWLVSRPESGSGGHVHGQSSVPRPRGTFFLASEVGQVSRGTAGHRDSVQVTLSDSGAADVVYRTSGVSGREWVLVRDAASPRPGDSAVVVIRLGGLEQVPASSANYVLGASMNHPGSDEYLQPGAIEVLDSLAGAWKMLHRAHPDKYPMAGTQFSLDAASLSDGGLLDIRGDWWSYPAPTRGHLVHREGVDADFNNPAFSSVGSAAGEAAGDQFDELCHTFYFRYSAIDSSRLSCLRHHGTKSSPTDTVGHLHFHVFLVPIDGRDDILPWRETP